MSLLLLLLLMGRSVEEVAAADDWRMISMRG